MSICFHTESVLGSGEQKRAKKNEGQQDQITDDNLPEILSTPNPFAETFQDAMMDNRNAGNNLNRNNNGNPRTRNANHRTFSSGSASSPNTPSLYGSHWESFVHVLEEGPSSRGRDRIFILSGNFSSAVSWQGFLTKMTLQDALMPSENQEATSRIKCLDTGLGSGSHIISTQNDTVTVGLDSGIVQTYDYRLDVVSSNPIHHRNITQMIPSNKGQFVTSSSRDGSIAQFDLKEQKLRKRVEDAHIGHVHDITPHPGVENCNVFLSVGLDREIVLWDLKESSPGKNFGFMKGMMPTSIYWSSVNEQIFYVGTADSHIMMFDLRNTKIQVGGSNLKVNEINRIKPVKFTPSSQGIPGASCLAIVSKHNVLNVIEEESLSPIYQGSASHSGPIRDVAQIGDKVYSIGWNNHKLVQHHLEL